MNEPTSYKMLVVDVGTKRKRALIKFSRLRNQTLKATANEIFDKVLNDSLDTALIKAAKTRKK